MSESTITIPEGLREKLEAAELWAAFDTLVTKYPLTFSRILADWNERKYPALLDAIKIGMKNPKLFKEEDQEDATQIGTPHVDELQTLILTDKPMETPASTAPEPEAPAEIEVGPNIWDILTTGTVTYNPATKILQFIFVINGGARLHTTSHYIHMTITDGNGSEIKGSSSRAITNTSFNDSKKIPYTKDRWHTQREGTNAGTTPFFSIKNEELPDSLRIRFKGFLPMEKPTDAGTTIVEDVETAVTEIIISKAELFNGQPISLRGEAQ
jgi:hypothetical protein